MIVKHKILTLFDKSVFEMAIVAPPFKYVNHLNNEACFIYFMEGGNNHYSEKGRLQTNVQEGVLMNCGNYMFNITPDKDSGNCGFIAIHFYPDVLKRIYENKVPEFLKRRGNASNNYDMTLVKSNDLISRYIQSLSFFFENQSLIDEDLLVLKMKEIILLLSKVNSPAIVEIMRNLFSSRLVSFKEVIETHLFSPLSITDLAALTNCSLASFKRKFKKEYEDSPANYIKNRRLDRAAEMLKVSEYSISEIGYDCMFNDIAHFSSSFKTKYKCTPSEYRLS